MHLFWRNRTWTVNSEAKQAFWENPPCWVVVIVDHTFPLTSPAEEARRGGASSAIIHEGGQTQSFYLNMGNKRLPGFTKGRSIRAVRNKWENRHHFELLVSYEVWGTPTDNGFTHVQIAYLAVINNMGGFEVKNNITLMGNHLHCFVRGNQWTSKGKIVSVTYRSI